MRARTTQRALACERGNTIIEFAMVLPVLLWLVSGIFEYGMIFYAGSVLEGAVTASSRMGRTGFSDTAETGVSREDMIHASLKARASMLLDPAKVQIESKVYGQFEDVGRPENYVDANSNGQYDMGESFQDMNGNGVWDRDVGIAGVGGADNIVVYTASYPWPVFTPFMAGLLALPNDTFTLRSSVVVKNEPWDDAVAG